MPPELFGPAGLLVALLVAVAALWRDHLRADAEDRKQRDNALAGWAAQTEATNRLATAIEQQSREQSERHRRADA